MATGLLLIMTGNATRLARFFEKQYKTYEAEIKLGFISDTYDADGVVVPTGKPLPEPAVVNDALNEFRGSFLQTPPPVSAKKINGVPAYKLARKQQSVELAPVPVEVKSLVLHEIRPDALSLTVTVSAAPTFAALHTILE
jgi:tRNA pseudouridine55 synthase